MQETLHLSQQHFEREGWQCFHADHGKAMTFVSEDLTVCRHIAHEHMVAVAFGDLCVMNMYLPDSEKGNDRYKMELQRAIQIHKEFTRRGTKHWVIGTDAQVAVPPDVGTITGKITTRPPINAKPAWFERQAQFLATMQ